MPKLKPQINYQMADNGATATWSGYNHQGKVGLFVALREMAQLASDSGGVKAETFGNWYVEFEGAEDFDICTKPPCPDPTYLHSRHQVKAYAGNDGRYFSDYKKVTEPYTNQYGTDMPGFNKNIENENGTVIVGPEVPVDRRFIHLVQSVPSWKYDTTKNPNQVGPYEYPEYKNVPVQNYCGLSNSANYTPSEDNDDIPLDELAYKQMSSIVAKNRSEIKLIWQALQVELQKRISFCHDDDTKPRPKFTFQEISDDFLQNNVSLSNYIEDYQADIFRRSLINAWHDIQEQYEDGGSIDEDARARIEAWLRDIQKKSTFDLNTFIDSFSPHKSPAPKDIQHAGLHAVVCEVIRQVKATPSIDVHHYKKDGTLYFLTTISDDVDLYPNSTLGRHISRGIDSSSDNRYKQPCVIVTKNHDFDLDDSVFTDQLEYDRNSEKLREVVIAGVEVPNFKAYQSRKVIPVDKAVLGLNKEDEA
jgi:hypothetical protein